MTGRNMPPAKQEALSTPIAVPASSRGNMSITITYGVTMPPTTSPIAAAIAAAPAKARPGPTRAKAAQAATLATPLAGYVSDRLGRRPAGTRAGAGHRAHARDATRARRDARATGRK